MDISSDKLAKSYERILTRLRKGNPERKTESLRIATQNNAIRINYVKAEIDKTQQNNEYML